jgi:hypothetical protein
MQQEATSTHSAPTATKSLQDEHLNLHRVRTTFGEDGTKVSGLRPTDFSHLCELSTGGIELFLPDNFNPQQRCTPSAHQVHQGRTCGQQAHRSAGREGHGTAAIPCRRPSHPQPPLFVSALDQELQRRRIICDVANAATPDEVPLNGLGKVGKALL